MVATNGFKRGVERRLASDPAFLENMLCESLEALLREYHLGRRMLRDYIKASIGYEKLSEATFIPAKSLTRMFNRDGNPRSANLFRVILYLQQHAGVELRVTRRQAPEQPSALSPRGIDTL